MSGHAAMVGAGLAGMVIALGIFGCGGGSAAGPTPGDPEAAQEPPPIVAPPRPWAELAFDEKRRHMADHVLPVMEPIFMEFDRERFGDFSCETCHGDDMGERHFEMPNPANLPLWPTGSPEQQAMLREHREMATFMFNRVVPTMRELLGMPEFNAETGEGFSCYFCHPRGGGESSDAPAPDPGGAEAPSDPPPG